MTREEAKALLPILQAYAEGKVIECRTKPSTIKGTDVPNDWAEMKEIELWNNTEYRIKPEPKYRPFKDAEECWTEMLKHQPFGWVKSKDNTTLNKFMFIDGLQNNNVCISKVDFTYNEMVKYYIFTDGTPFGAKVKK